jgi:hypothetical protein
MIIERNPISKDATIAASAAISAAIDNSGISGGAVLVPGTWTAANIGFKVCNTKGGTFVPLRDQAGSLVQITNVQTGEADAYTLPDELFGCLWFKVWSCTSAGVDTNQAAERACTVMAKG